jgi:hypothetical protein
MRAAERRVVAPRAMPANARPAADWLGSFRASAAAWWLPQLAIIAALLVPLAIRTAIWVIALAWMGTACILNSRRCGRTHCRFTGPYYFVLILPTLLFGSAMISVTPYLWFVLAGLIILGGGLVWWATERAWGKFSGDV